MVGCAIRYSKHFAPPLSLVRAVQGLDAESVCSALQPVEQAPRQRVANRLTVGDISAIVAEYRSGLTSRELAERHGLRKTAVQDLLHGSSVPMRKQPLSAEQVAVASELYLAGLSLAAVADQLKTHPSTVWRMLTRAGVKLRPRPGR
jgi:DNA-directed RNA polymerase specialized sigma24 family protein